MLTPTVTEISRLSAHQRDLPSLTALRNRAAAAGGSVRRSRRGLRARRFRTDAYVGARRTEQLQRIH
jgi:hypothetical protein